MRFIADLQIHSKYSRATSSRMNLEVLDEMARRKGILVMGTGDATHPLWVKELKEKLEPAEPGLLKLRALPSGGASPFTRFMLTAEVSLIYSRLGKVRKVHQLLFFPNFKALDAFNTQLAKVGNLMSDGRPIIGLDSEKMAEFLFGASPDNVLIPAHCLLPQIIVHTRTDLVKQIQDIKKGDYVMTHAGRWQSVESVLKRKYEGKVIHIRPYYFRKGLVTTPEHPYYAIKTKKNCCFNNGICKPEHKSSRRCMHKYYKQYRPEWIMARELEAGDVLIYPRFKKIISSTTQVDILAVIDMDGYRVKSGRIIPNGTRGNSMHAKIFIDERFCRLVGYFLAEGYVNGRDAIGFTFSKDEKLYVRDVVNLMKEVFGFDARPKLKEHSSHAVEITFYSKVLCDLFSRLFYTSSKHGAQRKRLPDWALGLKQSLQVEIFKGWWRGDKGYTVSRTLMNQMKIILLRLGIVPSIYEDTQGQYKKRGKHKYNGRQIRPRSTLYSLVRLAFFEDNFGLLNEPEFKQFRTRTSVRHGWVDEENIFLPIRDIESKQYYGAVYNLEVEKDNSYVAEFATVHNCWTPWFSVFGARSGFDNLEECFGKYTGKIFAAESGLSSDPPMNWRLKQLDQITIVSNSDAHSPEKIGREANVFDTELSYPGIIGAIKTADPKKFLMTLEFFPEEGKYHYPGHRACKLRATPEQAKAWSGICPKCGRLLTDGVLTRVEALASFPQGHKSSRALPFKYLIPLQEIIAEALDTGVGTKAVQGLYNRITDTVAPEFEVVMNAKISAIEKAAGKLIAQGVHRVREGQVKIEPGYDGEFGKIHVFTPEERLAGGAKDIAKQARLI